MTINHNTNTGITKAVNAKSPTYSQFGLKVDEPSECIITNLNAPIGRDETVRYANFDVDNIYRNSGISIDAQQPVKAGVKVVISIRQVWSIAKGEGDTTVPSYSLPVTGQLSLTIPKNEVITAGDVEQLMLQVLGAAYDAQGSSKVANLIKGSLKPSEI